MYVELNSLLPSKAQEQASCCRPPPLLFIILLHARSGASDHRGKVQDRVVTAVSTKALMTAVYYGANRAPATRQTANM